MPLKDPVERLEWQRQHAKKPHVIERKKREYEKTRLRRKTKEGNAYYYGLNIQKRYGITFVEYTEIFSAQHGCCAICGAHQSQFKRRLHIDHCHATGNVRGLLCTNCNSAIGKLKDSPEIMRRAIDYMLRQPGGSEFKG